MTENEAIRGVMFLKEKLYNGIYADRLDCIDYAISALEEIQQYREIGASPERIAKLILESGAIKRILGHYQKIGTLQQCREAMEKQKQKPCEFYGDEEDGKLLCPNCGEDLWDLKECGFNNCPYCGQKVTL